MIEKVLESDNGIIATALELYSDFIKKSRGSYTGNQPLLDRVNELQVIFQDKDSSQRYELGVEE